MPENVIVSVIVPNFNHARFLPKRFESIWQQSFQNFEVIVLDDCSTDNSKEIIENYRNHPKIAQIVYNTKNSGSPFKQWKKGIKLAKGKLIWIAESDDFAEPTFLEKMVALLENGNGLAYCRSSDVDENGNVKSNSFWADGLDENRWKSNYQNSGTDEIKNYLVYRCTIPNASACVFQKKLAPLHCGFDKMRYCGDWLFWIKLLENSTVAFDANTLNHFRHHQQSTRNRKSKKEEHRKELEIISIIELTRKKFHLGLPQPHEYPKYDWVIKGFYRKLLVPKELKHKLIFFSNRYYPKLYETYRAFFKQ
jgi:glycosyltransferase involved in cell wall biosynthesis